jgi:two-component system, chemotaxis family, CheB/CheR fusion protein
MEKKYKEKRGAEAENGAGRKNAEEEAGRNRQDTEAENGFPIVGIGASAGGLDALKKFFSEVKEESGMAYIVVVHLSPKQPSMMPDILTRFTKVPVDFAKDGENIEPDRVYVTPSDKEINVYKGTLQLHDLVKRDVPLPIDFFLRSLARDQGHNAVGIILSGTGTDGTVGVKEIKSREGLVLVQSIESAEYTGMPNSVIQTGITDKILEPGEMPDTLAHFFTNPRPGPPKEEQPVQKKEKTWLNKVFSILATQVGHDFSEYKESTIRRRLQRRMDLNQISDHDRYIRLLRENPQEADQLFREFLIGVTHFFREPEAFEALKENILPEIFGNMDKKVTFRAWVAGCSTGEEVYSLAIVIREYLQENPRQVELQLFGTDIDRRAIDKAREGLYTSSIAADVSDERLQKFFTKEKDHYRIRKDIRESIVFSVHDVLKDPPFSRLNLLCCRNLLIYLKGEVQKKILPLFHYTLESEGVLMLGSSETVGQFSNLFKLVDNKWKLFKRREIPYSMRGNLEFPTGLSRQEKADEGEDKPKSVPKKNIETLAKNVLLEKLTPTAVLIDESGTIIHVHGRTGKYLETVSGPPTHNIFDMAREGLRFELSSALRNAKSSDEVIVRKKLTVKTNGDVQPINLYIHPITKPKELYGNFLVVLEDIEEGKEDEGAGQPPEEKDEGEHQKIRELEEELRKSREDQQSTVEELESANEELKSTNEELQSSNEELQSTNEELESSKEELQSLNEELQTVNSELQSKVDELAEAEDDLHNLLNSTQVATVFVDNDIRIKRFTKEAAKLINIIQPDIGRPLEQVTTNLKYKKLIEDIRWVLDKLTTKEKEIQTEDGIWYKMRIIPYRTTDNRIDGAVITFMNIEEQKETQEELEQLNRETEQARLLIRRVFDMNPDPLAVLDKEGRLVIANTVFNRIMNIEEEEVKGTNIMDLENEVLTDTDLKEKLTSALKEDRDFTTKPVSVSVDGGEKKFRIIGQVIKQKKGTPYRILLGFEERA